ncbi:MAG TPA: PAS domain S-box protein, partial [Bryobacteraceae bacterium]|nr:PAS domain S-box protein [Bryobacteraceae bacterium]
MPLIAEQSTGNTQLTGLVNAAIDGIITLDQEQRIVLFNPAAERVFGYSAEQMFGQPLDRLLPLRFRHSHANGIRDFANTDVPDRRMTAGRSVWGLRANGEEFPLEASISQFSAEGRRYFSVILRDISERKRTEDQLKASLREVSALKATLEANERRFRAYIEQAGDAIFVHDFSGRLVEVNQQACTSLGYTREELLRLSIFDLETDFDLPGAQAVWSRIEPEHPCTLLGHHRRKDGSVFPVEVRFGCFDLEGERRYLGFVRDINERRDHERELERLNRLYSALSQINKAIVRMPARDELFRQVCRILTTQGGFSMVWVGCPDPDGHRQLPVAVSGDVNNYLGNATSCAGDMSKGPGVSSPALRDRQVHLCNDLMDARVALPLRVEMQRCGYRSAATFPIRMGGETYGSLTVYGAEADLFQDKEVALLEEAAQDISFALDNLAREEERERDGAAARKAEFFSETIMESMPGIVCINDEHGGFLRWNREFEFVSGYSGQEIARKRLLSFFVAEDKPLAEQRIAEAFNKGKASVEVSLVTRDRRVTPYYFSIRRIVFDGVSCLVGIGIDITERRQAEEAKVRLAAIVASSDDAIVGKTLAGIITSWNPGATKIFGYSAEEAIGQPATILFGPELVQEEAKILERLARGESVKHFDTLRIRKNGSQINVSVTISPVTDNEGRVIGASTIARDITETKQSEGKLRASEGRYRRLFESAKDGIFILDVDTGQITDANPFALEMLGYQQTELLGRKLWEVPPLRAIADCQSAFQDLQKNQTLHFENLPLETTDGRRIYVEFISNVYLADDHKVMQCSIRDITERRRAELALQEGGKRFQTMANSIPQLAWTAHPDGFIHWYNQRWYDYTGTTPEQMEGWGWQSIHDPKILPRVMAEWKAAIAAGKTFEMEFPLRSADGQFRMFLARAVPLKDGDAQVVQWFGTNTDVDELKRIEDTLRVSEERYRTLFEYAPDGILITDPNSYCLDVNSSLCRMLGYPLNELIGLHASDLVEETDSQRISLALADITLADIKGASSPDHREWRFKRKDGSVFLAEAISAVLPGGNLLGMVRDVTDRTRAEEEVRRLHAELEQRV